MPVACFGLEVSFGVNHNQREWKTFSWAFYFYRQKMAFFWQKGGFLVMVAPEPLIICSETLQNALL